MITQFEMSEAEALDKMRIQYGFGEYSLDGLRVECQMLLGSPQFSSANSTITKTNLGGMTSSNAELGRTVDLHRRLFGMDIAQAMTKICLKLGIDLTVVKIGENIFLRLCHGTLNFNKIISVITEEICDSNIILSDILHTVVGYHNLLGLPTDDQIVIAKQKIVTEFLGLNLYEGKMYNSDFMDMAIFEKFGTRKEAIEAIIELGHKINK